MKTKLMIASAIVGSIFLGCGSKSKKKPRKADHNVYQVNMPQMATYLTAYDDVTEKKWTSNVSINDAIIYEGQSEEASKLEDGLKTVQVKDGDRLDLKFTLRGIIDGEEKIIASNDAEAIEDDEAASEYFVENCSEVKTMIDISTTGKSALPLVDGKLVISVSLCDMTGRFNDIAIEIKNAGASLKSYDVIHECPFYYQRNSSRVVYFTTRAKNCKFTSGSDIDSAPAVSNIPKSYGPDGDNKNFKASLGQLEIVYDQTGYLRLDRHGFSEQFGFHRFDSCYKFQFEAYLPTSDGNKKVLLTWNRKVKNGNVRFKLDEDAATAQDSSLLANIKALGNTSTQKDGKMFYHCKWNSKGEASTIQRVN